MKIKSSKKKRSTFRQNLIRNETIIPLSNTVYWDLSRDFHFLIAGITGSGKTKAAQYIMMALADRNYRIYYLDPKDDDEMQAFARSEGIVYISDINQIAKTVREIEKEMRERKKLLDEIGKDEHDFRPIYIVFDEVIAYQAIAPKKTVDEVKNVLKSIITMGRKKKVFCGLIAARPDTEYIDGVIREQLGCRIVMGQGSKALNKMVFGNEHENVENLRSGEKGSGLIMRTGDKQPREVMMPHLHIDI